MGKQWKQWLTLFWGAAKSLQMVPAVMKLKDACSLEEKLWQTWREVKWSKSHSVVSDFLQLHGLHSPWNSPGQNTGVGTLPFSRGSSQPRDRPRSWALQADSLLVEPQGRPKNTRARGLPRLQQIFPTQESKRGLLHHRQILYQLSYEGSPDKPRQHIKKQTHFFTHKGPYSQSYGFFQ